MLGLFQSHRLSFRGLFPDYLLVEAVEIHLYKNVRSDNHFCRAISLDEADRASDTQSERDGDFTHDGVSGIAIDRGCVVGESVASGAGVGAGVEARGMGPIHLTTMKGVVLRRDRQWLPLLDRNETHTKGF